MAKRKPTPTPVTAKIIRLLKGEKLIVPLPKLPTVAVTSAAYDLSAHFALRPELFFDVEVPLMPVPGKIETYEGLVNTVDPKHTATAAEIVAMTNEELAAYMGKATVPNMDKYVLPVVPRIYVASDPRSETSRAIKASEVLIATLTVTSGVRTSRRSVGNIPAPHERPAVRNVHSCLR